MGDQEIADNLLAITRDGLMALGYTGGLLRFDYRFAEITSPGATVERIALAAFAQEPPSYRTACFAVAPIQDSKALGLRRYAPIGAPQLLTLHGYENRIRRWIVRPDTEPDFIESLTPEDFRRRLNEHQQEWGPQEILRAKSLRHPSPKQLDFFDAGLVPVLEAAVQAKVDQLLRDVLALCEDAYRERHNSPPDYGALYRLIFRLLAAKLLLDREHPGPWDSPDAETVISAIDTYYFSQHGREHVLEDPQVRHLAWRHIRTGLALQNLSVETLAYVYENTLVDPKLREAQDIHATPREIAEYVVSRLPFEELATDQRTVLEPFAGHAPFLIAAMSRLRSLLPRNFDAEGRHRYFVNMLAGMEVDPFAREVARYSLTLADYPNPNGWKILPGDVFAGQELNAHLRIANVVLCNPPFGDFTQNDIATNTSIEKPNKAAEILRRVLEQPPKLMGFVLPRVFAQGPSYEELRRTVANVYAETTLIVLPDVSFRHSEVEPVLLIAHSNGESNPKRRSAFVSKSDFPEFLRSGKVTWEHESRPSGLNPDPPLWTHPLLSDLLDVTRHLQKLEEVADIHQGVQYKRIERRFFSEQPKEGYVPGLAKVRNAIEPYLISKHGYILIRDDLMLYQAHLRPWDRPKIIANAARISRGAWTITAAPDYEGLVCSQGFHGVWPTEDLPLEFIAALLVGPVANAFIGLQITSRHNQRRLLAGVPVPKLPVADLGLIVELVQRYQQNRKRWLAAPLHATALEAACRQLLLEIDAIVLSGYDLPPRLERELLNRFAGEPRPGPVHFDHYYPEGFVPAIPLRRFISKEFEASSANRTIDRLTLIDDPAVSDVLQDIE